MRERENIIMTNMLVNNHLINFKSQKPKQTSPNQEFKSVAQNFANTKQSTLTNSTLSMNMKNHTIAFTSKKTIEDKRYERSFESVKKYLKTKELDGKRIYDDKFLEELSTVYSAEKYEVLRKMVDQKLEKIQGPFCFRNEYDYYFRFLPDDIFNILKVTNNSNKDIVLKLISAKYGKGESYRFNYPIGMKSSPEKPFKFPKPIYDDLYREPVSTSRQIVDILTQVRPQNRDLLDKLLKTKYMDREYFRFGDSDLISSVLKSYNESELPVADKKQLLDKIFNAKTIDGKYYRFNNYNNKKQDIGVDIAAITWLFKNDNKDLFNRLFNEKITNPDGSEDYRFTPNDTARILGIFSLDSELCNFLLNEKSEDGNYKFNTREMMHISSFYKNDTNKKQTSLERINEALRLHLQYEQYYRDYRS